MHSAQYVCADEWRGKKGVVVGTANTGRMSLNRLRRPTLTHVGHDVAEDMLAAGLSSVTLVQRGRTGELQDLYQSEAF